MSLLFVDLVLKVAIICNHQRSVSKSHDVQMSRLSEKMRELQVMTISPSIMNYLEWSVVFFHDTSYGYFFFQLDHTQCRHALLIFLLLIKNKNHLHGELWICILSLRLCLVVTVFILWIGCFGWIENRLGEGKEREASIEGFWWEAKEEHDPRSVYRSCPWYLYHAIFIFK